ncbi:MAG: hypothetical protein RL318_1442 [Fibrobacterota bacterium]|jgi:rhodanese-related sulfurtransferase
MKDVTTKDLLTPGALPANCDFIDVREPAEVQSGRWEKARNVPLATIPDEAKKLDKHRPVVMICAAGGRSARAASQLEALGFREVYNLAGGMGQAVREGLPTVTGGKSGGLLGGLFGR